ncbi:MAG TPA: N-acetylmuramoyl-L-alanine amidase, partial [Candidatus Dormibacteraeota bacterium]|nr:N-acetylmuramoyl-L-alanine amidase [Candidatus Dormibacteraeota bacterium]
VAAPIPQSVAVAPTNPPVQASFSAKPSSAPVFASNETWVPLARWCRSRGFSGPSRIGPPALPDLVVSTPSGILKCHAGSNLAFWNGIEVHLGFGPQVIEGQPYLHALDINKTLEPLLNSNLVAPARLNRTIVLDPGHGGENAGTRSALVPRYEKEFTLDWARRLAPLLETNGWQVFLTRTSDADLSLADRTAIADAHNADLFLSLHFNSASPDEYESGLETYTLTPPTMPSTLTRGFPDDLLLTFPNNQFDAQNLQFAASVHRALLQVNGNHDRGIRRARFLGVLRAQKRPAILVEGGYLSNPREARLIGDPDYRQRLAEAVATAIVSLDRPGATSAGLRSQANQ